MPDNPSLNRKILVAGAVGILVGFLIGFYLANALNRDGQGKLRAEQPTGQGSGSGKGQQASAQGGGDQPQSITEEQIRNAVTKADQTPQDAEMQKKVGQGLMLYASQTGNASYLVDGARILKRAHDLDPKDYKTTVMAGDAHFLIDRQGAGDPKLIAEARKFYEAALAAQPDDVIVRTKLGLTYFYDTPPDARRAISEYQRALELDPRQEMTLQSLAAALIETEQFELAARRLDELGKLNPSNGELPGLRTELEQKRNAAKEK